jgi:hypothetical protein
MKTVEKYKFAKNAFEKCVYLDWSRPVRTYFVCKVIKRLYLAPSGIFFVSTARGHYVLHCNMADVSDMEERYDLFWDLRRSFHRRCNCSAQ